MTWLRDNNTNLHRERKHLLDDFKECTTKRQRKNGRNSINCKLGLWGVSATSEDQAMVEALRYFIQYKNAGEYSSIIGGKTVSELLRGNSNE